MIKLARQNGRYGYRRIAALLREAGWHVNDKRAERLWRREGLKVPMKQPRRVESGGMMDHASGLSLSVVIMSGHTILFIVRLTRAFDHCPRTNGQQDLIIRDAEHQ